MRPQPPLVVLTSNRTREVHDALKRRCLYQWLEYPSSRRSWRSSAAGAEASLRLAEQVTALVQELSTPTFPRFRRVRDDRLGGGARRAGHQRVTEAAIEDTLAVVLKAREDAEALRGARIWRSPFVCAPRHWAAQDA